MGLALSLSLTFFVLYLIESGILFRLLLCFFGILGGGDNDDDDAVIDVRGWRDALVWTEDLQSHVPSMLMSLGEPWMGLILWSCRALTDGWLLG